VRKVLQNMVSDMMGSKWGLALCRRGVGMAMQTSELGWIGWETLVW
jgi:hypothetical protein